MGGSSTTTADELLDEQASVLELIVRGRPLAEVLARLCAIVEAHTDGARAAILLVEAGVRLRIGAAPSLPASYNCAVDGIAIGAEVGTCCHAAATREVVITPDIARDRRWADLRHLPLAHGLVAAWSMPILSATGAVLGTFGTYFLTPREPDPHERRLIEVLSRTAALAIERHLSERRRTFLADLDAATHPLAEPAEVMAITARMLAEHLDVDRCAYAEIEDERVFVITGDHSRGVASVVGRWDVAAFGPACVEHMAAGTPYIVVDSEADPRIGPEHVLAYRATDIRAVICVPLHKDGTFTAAMAVHQRVARQWATDEIELVGQVVARCWEALERARVTRERVAADRALARSRARLEYAVRLSRVGFWYCDLPFDELSWDEQVKDHFFLPPDARVTIDTFYDRIHPDDREPTRAAIEASIRDHTSYDVVYRTVDPDSGAVRFIRALGGTAYAADGTPRQFDGVTLEVTAQKHDEQRLASLAAAALTINSSSSLESVLRVVTEEARQIIGAHQAVASLTDGPDQAQVINTVSLSSKYQSFRGYAAPPTGAGIYSLVARTNQPMRLTQAELEAHDAWRGFSGEGPRHPPMRGWLAVPFVGRSGANLGMVQLSDKYEGEFTAADEAVLVQLAQLAAVAIENARLYDQLRDQDRRKDEFLATLAHELRNPLAPIRTGLHILHSSTSPAQATRTREMMERQLGHLVRMVDDLLDISRVTLGKVTLEKQRVELRSVIDSALETTRPLVESRKHELMVRVPAEPLPLDGDPTRLAQVFANLINNAAKYTPPGGRIDVTVAPRADTVEVRVSDTGIGIPADMLPRVFDMFTQVGPTLERSQGGLGIGLTLVRRLVEMHGGTVDAESQGPGTGSTFVLRLPRATSSAGARTATAPGASPPAPALRILVVDDNVDGAEALSMLLELQGNQTGLAHDGHQALRAVREQRPDVVFLDIGLPGLNGYEVARTIRADPALAQPLLVAVTGYGTEEDRRQAQAAGFDCHLVKPVPAHRLHDVLSRARSVTPPGE